MNFNGIAKMEVLAQKIKSKFEVVSETVYGHGVDLVIKVSEKYFAIVLSETGVTIYQVFKDPSGDFQFLPGFKEGSSLRVVENFIKART